MASTDLKNRPKDIGAAFSQQSHFRIFLAAGGTATLLAVAPLGVRAAEIQFQPIISVSETYTDNVLLSPPGLEQSDYVNSVRAGFTLSGVGRRARINLNFSPSVLSYAKQNEVQFRDNFSGTGQMELVEDQLFLEGSGNITKRVLNQTEDISISERNLSGDRRRIYTGRIGPEWRQRFGSKATASISYDFSIINTEESADGTPAGFSDSRNHTVSASINSGPDFQRLGWGLSGNWKRQNRVGDGPDPNDRSFYGSLRYRVNRFVSLTGRAGLQEYRYAGSSGETDVNWDVGVGLTPNRRLNLNITYGDETDNRRWTVSGSYQLEGSTFITVSYNESFQTSQEILLEELPGVDGDIISSPGLGGGFDFFDPPSLPQNTNTDEVFLQKRWSLSLSHQFDRAGLTFSSFHDRRSIDGEPIEKSYGGFLRMNYQFSRKLSGSVAANYIHRDEPDGRKDDIYTGSAYLSRSLSGAASLFLSYDYTRRDSNAILAEVRENAVTIGLTASF